ncbi:MAG: tyrosine-type recombinase/integrase [Dehalococcoidia bacterium]|nr:tyrosine-type recombinase/integrase [Dehalococcoidia bacterium]
MARGHLVKRSKGSWSLVINQGKDETGKRKQQWLTVQGTRKQAEAKLADVLHEMDTGAYVSPSKLTTGQFLTQWIQDYSVNLSPQVADRYAEIIRLHLVPEFGRIPLSDLKPARIQSYYTKALKVGRVDGKGGLSAQTVLHFHHLLHVALETAVRQGLLARNPASACTPPQPKHCEMVTVEHDHVTRFLQAAQKSPYYVVFYLDLFTGMRRSEILALKWSRVDLDLCHLSVVESLHRLRNGEFILREPKSKRGKRLISLSSSVALLLREHKAAQENIRRELGLPLRPNDLVFARPDGSYIKPYTITRCFKTIARNIGQPELSLKSLRHTHASLMLREGVHPKIVSERLGHSTISITLDRYSHVTEGIQEAAALRFEESLKDSIEQVSVSKRLAKSFLGPMWRREIAHV